MHTEIELLNVFDCNFNEDESQRKKKQYNVDTEKSPGRRLLPANFLPPLPNKIKSSYPEFWFEDYKFRDYFSKPQVVAKHFILTFKINQNPEYSPNNTEELVKNLKCYIDHNLIKLSSPRLLDTISSRYISSIHVKKINKILTVTFTDHAIRCVNKIKDNGQLLQFLSALNDIQSVFPALMYLDAIYDYTCIPCMISAVAIVIQCIFVVIYPVAIFIQSLTLLAQCYVASLYFAIAQFPLYQKPTILSLEICEYLSYSYNSWCFTFIVSVASLLGMFASLLCHFYLYDRSDLILVCLLCNVIALMSDISYLGSIYNKFGSVNYHSFWVMIHGASVFISFFIVELYCLQQKIISDNQFFFGCAVQIWALCCSLGYGLLQAPWCNISEWLIFSILGCQTIMLNVFIISNKKLNS